MSSSNTSPLDRSVASAIDALVGRSFPGPSALLLLGTGEGTLPARLEDATEVELGQLLGIPPPWRESRLRAGFLSDLPVWLVEDAPFEPPGGTPRSGRAPYPWERAFPVWLAAAAGAETCLLTAGARALPPLPPPSMATAGEAAPAGAAPPNAGDLFLVRDHLNLSGGTPLAGLGATGLGPLFPDQTLLHAVGLRETARRLGRERGLPLTEGVLACTSGPALSTPAEALFYARAGAQAASQDTAAPLIACAHAGLDLLCIAPVLDSGHGTADVESMARTAEAAAPALEELLLALAGELAASAAAERDA